MRPRAARGSTHTQSDQDHVRERQAWFLSGRRAMGESPARLLYRAYRQKLSMRKRFSSQSAGSSPAMAATSGFSFLNWSSMGPAPVVPDALHLQDYGPTVGRVTAVAFDQNDASGNTVYIGGAQGGIWKSSNAAALDPASVLWQPLTDEQPSLAIGAIALQPGTGVVLAGTGEPDSTIDSYYGMGILRSTDSGASWTLISSADAGIRPFRGLGFSRIAFSTDSPNVVVAATVASNGAGSGAELEGAARGLYYSDDSGLTWQYANVSDGSSAPDPGSAPAVVYNPVHHAFYAAILYHGIYSSADGANWTRLANQPITALTPANCPASPTSEACPLYRADLAVSSSGEMYAVVMYFDANGNETLGGISKLTQAGGTWTALGTTGLLACGDNTGCGVEQGYFNLYIRAVPNGSTTDLYLGAVNLFKCGLGADPTCSSPGWKNLTHAYGCDPIAAPSHVHPDQHALESPPGDPQFLLLGNDGGVYRSRNASGLNSSLCTATNPFENVNSNMGSLSEVTGISQYPDDPGVVLAGLQDNGTPLLDPASSGAEGRQWTAINLGDGGYNAIDPASANIFYSSHFGVSVQRCVSGLACDSSGWSTVVSASTVGLDKSAFYLPYILDPENSSTLLVGTCRVWRMSSDGSGAAALSDNFSVGGTSSCSDADTKIRSLSAGGPQTTSGNASVIYAGMDSSGSAAGKLFVTTNSDAGNPGWVDRSGNINPSHYPVSSIAVSPFDTSGKTAYVTIMGFGNGHIFKTVDAGVSWTDISTNLPDAPANIVLLDPNSSNFLYLGNDVGAFISTDDGGSWAELGAGLPNVPVTDLKASQSAGELRASTYGRGVWQTTLPSETLALSSSSLAFAAVVGRTSPSQLVTITNNTGAATDLTLTVSGPFTETSTCPGILAFGASCQISVAYSATSQGSFAGAVQIQASSSGLSRTVALSGQGVDFTLSLSRPTRPSRSSSLTTVMAGQTADLTMVLRGPAKEQIDAWKRAGLLTDADLTFRIRCAGTPLRAVCRSPASVTFTGGETEIHVQVQTFAGRSRARRLRSWTGTARTPSGIYPMRVALSGESIERSAEFRLRVR